MNYPFFTRLVPIAVCLDFLAFYASVVQIFFLSQPMSSNTLPSSLSFSSNGGSFPPHGVITPNDHGPYVVVANWIFMCVMMLTVAIRLGTRVQTIKNLGIDDILLFIAAVSSKPSGDTIVY